MKESIILKYIWLLSGNFMIAILLAACNGSNIIPDNPDEEIEIIPERSVTFSLGRLRVLCLSLNCVARALV